MLEEHRETLLRSVRYRLDEACRQLGLKVAPVWYAEIEPAPSAVMAKKRIMGAAEYEGGAYMRKPGRSAWVAVCTSAREPNAALPVTATSTDIESP